MKINRKQTEHHWLSPSLSSIAFNGGTCMCAIALISLKAVCTHCKISLFIFCLKRSLWGKKKNCQGVEVMLIYWQLNLQDFCTPFKTKYLWVIQPGRLHSGLSTKMHESFCLCTTETIDLVLFRKLLLFSVRYFYYPWREGGKLSLKNARFSPIAKVLVLFLIHC